MVFNDRQTVNGGFPDARFFGKILPGASAEVWRFFRKPEGPDLSAGKEPSITFAASLNTVVQDATL